MRGQGCVAADLDADGRTDLYVTSAERGALLWNRGGRFEEGARGAGVDAFGWYAGAAAGDLNGDGLPELVLTGSADLNNRVPSATVGFPGTHLGVRDLLFVNEGEGRFREAGADAGLEVVRFEHGLGVLLCDVDRDGDLDAFVANDGEPDRLYENVAWPGGAEADPSGLGFRFEERAAAVGVADPGSGMGVAAGDYDGDGRVDLFVTNARRQVHGVFRAQADDTFADVRGELGPSFSGATGWGVSWADLDLDADLDLALVNGHIPVGDLRADAEPVQVFRAHRSRLAPVRAPLPRLLARGSAAADYDDDGDLDLAVAAVGGPLVLLENRGTSGTWLEVDVGFAPGAEATVVLPDGRRLRRQAVSGGSYLSSEDPRLHFGLGGARRVRELVVRWPGGAETRLEDVQATRRVVLERPACGRMWRRSPARASWPAAPSAAGEAATPTRSRAASAATSADDRWRASGTRRSWTQSAATSPRRPSTPATSSTSRRRCGTRGPRTTSARTATSCARSATRTTSVRPARRR